MTLRKIRAEDGRGMVTAELAVTTLAAFAVLTMMCWGIYLVVTQLRCVDAAAAIARQAARADTTAVGKAKAAAPSGATISIDKRPSLVTVIVRVKLDRWVAGCLPCLSRLARRWFRSPQQLTDHEHAENRGLRVGKRIGFDGRDSGRRRGARQCRLGDRRIRRRLSPGSCRG